MPQLQMPDSRIALGLGRGSGGGGGDNGGGGGGLFQTLGGLTQLGAARDQMELRRMEIQRKRDEEEDDRSIRDTLQQSETPDKAVEDLFKQGKPRAANLLGKQVSDHRKSQFDAYEKQLTNYGKRLEVAGQIMSGATDEPTFQSAKSAAGAILEPIFGQAIYEQMGNTYDKAKVDRLLKMGMSAAERNTVEQNGIANARAATTQHYQEAKDLEQFSRNQEESRFKWAPAIASYYLSSRNQTEWDYWRKQAVLHGAPDDLVAGFGSTWSDTPEAQQRIKTLGMTPAQAAAAERGVASGQRADEAGARAEDAAARAEAASVRAEKGLQLREKEAAAGGTAWTTKSKDYEDLEADIKRKYFKTTTDSKGVTTGVWADIPAGVKKEYGRQRLAIENKFRGVKGMPSLQEAIANAKASGDTAGLAKAQAEYDNLMEGKSSESTPTTFTPGPATPTAGGAALPTQTTPLTVGAPTSAPPAPRSTSPPVTANVTARANELMAKIKTEKDPAAKLKMRQELQDILKQIRPAKR